MKFKFFSLRNLNFGPPTRISLNDNIGVDLSGFLYSNGVVIIAKLIKPSFSDFSACGVEWLYMWIFTFGYIWLNFSNFESRRRWSAVSLTPIEITLFSNVLQLVSSSSANCRCLYATFTCSKSWRPSGVRRTPVWERIKSWQPNSFSRFESVNC